VVLNERNFFIFFKDFAARIGVFPTTKRKEQGNLEEFPFPSYTENMTAIKNRSMSTKHIQDYVRKGPSDEVLSSSYMTGGLTPVLSKYLPENMILSEEETLEVEKGMDKLYTGLRATMPMNCKGDVCVFKKNCPLWKIGKAPVSNPCSIEAMLLDLHTKRYIDEFNVSPDLLSEVTAMTMLASTHVLEMRAFMLLGMDLDGIMADGPTGTMQNMTGMTKMGDPIYRTEEHPAFSQLERAWNWRKNILESLAGTRKEKYKKQAMLKEIGDISASLASANLKSAIEKLTVEVL